MNMGVSDFVDSDRPHVDHSDVDECLSKNGGCDRKRTCINTEGGRTCGDCPSGYVKDGETGCKGECSISLSVSLVS